jgi:hypothetical protein
VLDTIAAHDDQALARAHHQCFHDRKPLDAGRLGDAGHAKAARQQAGAAHHGQHQQQRAEIAKKIEIFHDVINKHQA